MTLKVSTGMRNQVLDGGSIKTALNLGFIDFYTGSPPASADDAATGTKLCRVTNNSTGTGLTLGTSSAGIIPKNPSETWSGVNIATGTAGYFRYVEATDDGTLSTTQKRLQGTCGTIGTDMNMSSVNMVNGAPQVIDGGSLTLPAEA